MIQRAHKIELDLTASQRLFMARACGTARYTWNWALEQVEKHYAETGETIDFAELKKRWNKEKPEWIYESPKDANQQPFAFLRKAYLSFFKGTSAHPTFKKKGVRDSFYLSNDKFDLSERHARLPITGKVRLKESPRFSGKILSGTVSRRANHWFLAISYELPAPVPIVPERDVLGIDLGIKHLAVLSDGTRVPNPEHLQKAEQRLKRWQRIMSRRQKASRNRERARKRVGTLHYKVTCQRQDFTHKLTTAIVRKAKVVVMEDLNVSGMSKNHALAKSVMSSAFYEVRRQVAYKTESAGTRVVYADRFYPSSKTCSSCGLVNHGLRLSDRSWTCACGMHHDRDFNAALNLESLGKAIPEVKRAETGDQVGKPTGAGRRTTKKPERTHVCSRVS